MNFCCKYLFMFEGKYSLRSAFALDLFCFTSIIFSRPSIYRLKIMSEENEAFDEKKQRLEA